MSSAGLRASPPESSSLTSERLAPRPLTSCSTTGSPVRRRPPTPPHPRPLTGRDRSIAIITALACQGVSGDRLGTHLRLGLQHGLDEDALTGLMTLLASYVGYPRASLAMEAIHDMFAPVDGEAAPR